MHFQVIFVLFAVCNAQQLFDLKSFPGATDTPIGGNGQYSIYVSASSDDDALLKQVSVKTATDEKTLYELKNAKLPQNTGLLQPFAFKDNAVLHSTLTTEQMGQLKGSLYITTAKQLQNTKGFFVYNVEVSEQISTTNALSDDVTIVFLNSNYQAQPWLSTTISGWKQDPASSVYIYEGIPTDDDEKKDSQIFSNPVTLTGGAMKFIPSVEYFSLNLGAFYVKAHKGVQFTIDPKFNDLNNRVTSSKTTTGFYMKPIATPDQKVTINTSHDNNFNGTTGVNVVGTVPANAKLGVTGPGNWASTPSATIQRWSAATIADTLSFETTNCVAGEVYVQYYVIQGDETVSTTTILPGRQTTARLQTSTKSTAVIQLFTSILVPFVGARYL